MLAYKRISFHPKLYCWLTLRPQGYLRGGCSLPSYSQSVLLCLFGWFFLIIFQARIVSHCGNSIAHHPVLCARLGKRPVDTTRVEVEILQKYRCIEGRFSRQTRIMIKPEMKEAAISHQYNTLNSQGEQSA